MLELTELKKTLARSHPDFTVEIASFREETTLTISDEALLPIAQLLQNDPSLTFDYLSDLTCVDYLPRVPRFELVYHLYSMQHNHRLRVKVPINETKAEIHTVVDLWPAANWHEREVFDLFGITFKGHPDLRRILMPDDWEGYPLRKDYPLFGFQDPVERFSGGRENFER